MESEAGTTMPEVSGRYLEDFEVGQRFTTPGRTITEADIVAYTGLSGDFNPLHIDEEFAKQTPFGTRIAQGALGLSVALGLISQTGLLAGTALGFLGLTDWKFTGPIKAGDTIRVESEVIEARVSSTPTQGVLVRKLRILNQRGEMTQTGTIAVLVKTRGS